MKNKLATKTNNNETKITLKKNAGYLMNLNILKNQSLVTVVLDVEEKNMDLRNTFFKNMLFGTSQIPQSLDNLSHSRLNPFKLLILSKFLIRKRYLLLSSRFRKWKNSEWKYQSFTEIIEKYNHLNTQSNNLNGIHQSKKKDFKKALIEYDIYKKNLCESCFGSELDIDYMSVNGNDNFLVGEDLNNTNSSLKLEESYKEIHKGNSNTKPINSLQVSNSLEFNNINNVNNINNYNNNEDIRDSEYNNTNDYYNENQFSSSNFKEKPNMLSINEVIGTYNNSSKTKNQNSDNKQYNQEIEEEDSKSENSNLSETRKIQFGMNGTQMINFSSQKAEFMSLKNDTSVKYRIEKLEKRVQFLNSKYNKIKQINEELLSKKMLVIDMINKESSSN